MSNAYGPTNGETEVLQTAEILAAAFAFPAEDARVWVEQRIGLDNLRVLREPGGVAAVLGIIPMGQWFGGQSVRMAGIAGVGVAPHCRGRGAATRLMQETMRELHAAGYPISSLYPATQPLYRRIGFEQAGVRCEIKVELGRIDPEHGEGDIRPIATEDASAIESLYAERARHADGFLDRGPYIWRRVREMQNEVVRGFMVEREGRPEGYVYFVQKKAARHDPFNLAATDVVAISPQAGRRLLAFFNDFRTTGREIIWHGGLDDPLLALMTEQAYQVRLVHHWMLRIVNVPAALEARGYPPAARAELHLDVRDDLLHANAGRWLVRIAEGRATVESGGAGRLRMDVRGLAMLYSGFASPAAMLVTGFLDASAADAHAATGVFAGASPAISDMF